MSDTGAQGPGSGAEQEMRMPTVPELVLSTAQLAISLAADEIARKGDLEQAQLAIDTADALMPVVGAAAAARASAPVPPRALRAAAGLRRGQRARRRARGRTGAGAAKDTQPTVETPPRPPIWTPGGDV